MQETLPNPVIDSPAPVPRRAVLQALTAMVAALQFLTIAPPLIRRPFSAEELGRAVGFFPLVGLAVGGLLIGIDHAARLVWPEAVAAALVLAAWVLVSGGLHLDGYLDTCDGMLAGHTPAERLRIMRDPQHGTFALAGGVLLLLVKFQAVASVSDRTWLLLLAPVLGRWAMTLAIVVFPYGRAEGLGRAMKDATGVRELLLATVITAGVLVAFAGWQALVALLLTIAALLMLARAALSRLGGFTGDVYGALCEIVEVLVVLLLAAGGAA
jgi:adenosylcobinamide-GDP ribazoletransferase